MEVAGSSIQAPPRELILTRDMLSTPPATTMSSQPAITFTAARPTASRAEAQNRSNCMPQTVSSQPATMGAILAILVPCSPTGITHPMMISSTRDVSRSCFFSNPFNNPANRSTGLTSCSDPSFLPLPRGVRTASYINAGVFIYFPYLDRSAGFQNNPIFALFKRFSASPCWSISFKNQNSMT